MSNALAQSTMMHAEQRRVESENLELIQVRTSEVRWMERARTKRAIQPDLKSVLD